ASGNELWQRQPIDALGLEGVRGRERRQLLTFRPLEQVRELGIYPTGSAFDLETARCLAATPHLRHLRALHLGWSHFDDQAATALARSPHLRPRFLSLSAHRMSAEGFGRLMNATFASHLGRLVVHRTPVYRGGRALPMVPTPWAGE